MGSCFSCGGGAAGGTVLVSCARFLISSDVAKLLISSVATVAGLLAPCQSQVQCPVELCRLSSWPLVREISPLCGTSRLCPVNCCSTRTAPLFARIHMDPLVSSPTSAS